MNTARQKRPKEQRLGQYFTPVPLARKVVSLVDAKASDRILEPSFGNGAFLTALLEAIAPENASEWAERHLDGCEIDPVACGEAAANWMRMTGQRLPHTLACADFFRWMPQGCPEGSALDRREYLRTLENSTKYDLVIGNPPFGAAFDTEIAARLDGVLGFRDFGKIKRESYAFFLVKCIDLLAPRGRLAFLCSDTILTIGSMAGLRRLMNHLGSVQVHRLEDGCFGEFTRRMVLLVFHNGAPPALTVEGKPIPLEAVEGTPNHSWRTSTSLAQFFKCPSLGEKMVATAGMTIGDNNRFLRKIRTDGTILEPLRFSFEEAPVSVEREEKLARGGRLSASRRRAVSEAEKDGATVRVLRTDVLDPPRVVQLPAPDYAPYNKAVSACLWSPPCWVVFWKDDGDALLTAKRNGPWYLRGVGGRRFFMREGLTWSLSASRMYIRYLPPGMVLDCGAPCAFLRPGVPREELFFILGWCLTSLANRLLKGVLNHTRNIQAKDFERLPYPSWVPSGERGRAVSLVKKLLKSAQAGLTPPTDFPELDRIYSPGWTP